MEYLWRQGSVKAEKEIMLTDMMEIHFIELPKFRAERHNLHDSLHRWLLFLEQSISDNLLEELMAMDPTIRGTEEQLEMLGSDEKARLMYEFRENSRIERNSLIQSGWIQGEQAGIEKGIRKGIDEGRKEIVRKFFNAGIDIEKIAEITEIPLDKVRRLLEG
jgi:predicted transposase/invertase (TIGR01784 family)